jgi:hypothetical protein
VRQRLLDAIYAGQSFRRVLGDLGLTSNQVWGLTKTDNEWLAALDTALAGTRRDRPQRHRCRLCRRLCVQRSAESISESAWRGIPKHRFNFGRFSLIWLPAQNAATTAGQILSDGGFSLLPASITTDCFTSWREWR